VNSRFIAAQHRTDSLLAKDNGAYPQVREDFLDAPLVWLDSTSKLVVGEATG
jgi:hypothetical protein